MKIEADAITLEAVELQALLKVASRDRRSNLYGVGFDPATGSVIAARGTCILVATLESPGCKPDRAPFLIPRPTMEAIAKAAGQDPVTVRWSDAGIVASAGGAVFAIEQVGDRLPPWQSLLPREDPAPTKSSPIAFDVGVLRDTTEALCKVGAKLGVGSPEVTLWPYTTDERPVHLAAQIAGVRWRLVICPRRHVEHVSVAWGHGHGW